METVMTKMDIVNAIRRVRGAPEVDVALLAEAAEAARRVFPSLPTLKQPVLEPVEEVLHLIDMALPGWSIQLARRTNRTAIGAVPCGRRGAATKSRSWASGPAPQWRSPCSRPFWTWRCRRRSAERVYVPA